MLSSLNSIIIEGTIVEIESTKEVDTKASCTFRIESTRYTCEKKEVSIFTVVAEEYLAETFIRLATKKKGVRIVGRLTQNEDRDILIVAEHIEFKKS